MLAAAFCHDHHGAIRARVQLRSLCLSPVAPAGSGSDGKCWLAVAATRFALGTVLQGWYGSRHYRDRRFTMMCNRQKALAEMLHTISQDASDVLFIGAGYRYVGVTARVLLLCVCTCCSLALPVCVCAQHRDCVTGTISGQRRVRKGTRVIPGVKFLVRYLSQHRRCVLFNEYFTRYAYACLLVSTVIVVCPCLTASA